MDRTRASAVTGRRLTACSMLHTHLHLHVALTIGSNVATWEPSKQQCSLGNPGAQKVLSLSLQRVKIQFCLLVKERLNPPIAVLVETFLAFPATPFITALTAAL